MNFFPHRFTGHILRQIHAISHRHHPLVLANSIPKAGTFLLNRLLYLLGFRALKGPIDIGPGEGLRQLSAAKSQFLEDYLERIKPGFFGQTHMYYYPEAAGLLEKLNLKCITIIRDPRDVCVSDSFYISNNSEHRLHEIYNQLTMDEQLMASINGMSSSQLGGGAPSLNIGEHYRNFAGWITEGAGITVKFENLVGDKGGGTKASQRESVEFVVNYLKLKLEEKEIDELCGQIFWPRSKTFRKGQIGSWRRHFKPKHRDRFNNVIGDTMRVYGYTS